jgi:hypothetical protein
VPIRDYAALTPWLTRAMAGEADVIWPGRVPYFGMSSGTTGGNKYLPITYEFVKCQRRGGFDPIAAYVRAGGARDVLDAAAILLGSSTELERRPGGALVGDNTGIMARHMPSWLHHKHLPSPSVRASSNWDEKIERLAAEAIDRDVRLLAGTPAWFCGLFDELLRVARRRGRRADCVLDVWPRLRLMTGGGRAIPSVDRGTTRRARSLSGRLQRDRRRNHGCSGSFGCVGDAAPSRQRSLLRIHPARLDR